MSACKDRPMGATYCLEEFVFDSSSCNISLSYDIFIVSLILVVVNCIQKLQINVKIIIPPG